MGAQARHKTVGGQVTKYRNKKVTVDGITFDSAKEARRWSELRLLEKAGQIAMLERQRVFILAPAVTLGGRKKPALRYVCDFCYEKDGAEVVEDVKSSITRESRAFRIKQHLMMSVHGIELLLT
jgi:hypothetical protein